MAGYASIRLRTDLPSRLGRQGAREAYWQEPGRFQPTDVYEQSLLHPGNVIRAWPTGLDGRMQRW